MWWHVWVCSLPAQGWVTDLIPKLGLLMPRGRMLHPWGTPYCLRMISACGDYQNKHGACSPRGTVCSRVGDFSGATSQRDFIWPPFVTGDHAWHTHSFIHARFHTHSYTHIHSVLGTVLAQTALWEQNLSQFIMSSAFTFVSAVLWTASGSAKESFLIRITLVISKPKFFLCSSLHFLGIGTNFGVGLNYWSWLPQWGFSV